MAAVISSARSWAGTQNIPCVHCCSELLFRRLIRGKFSDHFVDAEKQKLFSGCVDGSLMPVLFRHSQSRDQHRIIQLDQRAPFQKLADNGLRLQLIHGEQTLVESGLR